MKRNLLIVLLLVPFLAGAQNKKTPNPYQVQPNTKGERLFFIPTGDATEAAINKGYVSTESGKKILKEGLLFPYPLQPMPEMELYGNFTLYGKENREMLKTGSPYTYTLYTFNQRGDFLYHPYNFDNGPDYWVQGTRRIVAHGKMGLVNRHGQVVIPAKTYTYLEPAKWGLVAACINCTDNAASLQANTKQRFDVYLLDGTPLAKNFSYNQLPASYKEAALLQQMQGKLYADDSIVQHLAQVLWQLPEVQHYVIKQNMDPKEYAFYVYERPSAASAYYFFGLEEKRRGLPVMHVNFLISTNGKDILYIKDDLQATLLYKDWQRIPDAGRFKETWDIW